MPVRSLSDCRRVISDRTVMYRVTGIVNNKRATDQSSGVLTLNLPDAAYRISQNRRPTPTARGRRLGMAMLKPIKKATGQISNLARRPVKRW